MKNTIKYCFTDYTKKWSDPRCYRASKSLAYVYKKWRQERQANAPVKRENQAKTGHCNGDCTGKTE